MTAGSPPSRTRAVTLEALKINLQYVIRYRDPRRREDDGAHKTGARQDSCTAAADAGDAELRRSRTTSVSVSNAPRLLALNTFIRDQVYVDDKYLWRSASVSS